MFWRLTKFYVPIVLMPSKFFEKIHATTGYQNNFKNRLFTVFGYIAINYLGGG